MNYYVFIHEFQKVNKLKVLIEETRKKIFGANPIWKGNKVLTKLVIWNVKVRERIIVLSDINSDLKSTILLVIYSIKN